MQRYELFLRDWDFFQKSDNKALQTILTAVRAMKLTDVSLGLDTRYNARTKTSEKVLVLLLLPFFGCRHVSHAAADWVSRWLKVGYNTLYRLMRDEKIDWRRVLGTLASRTLDYVAANTEGGAGSPRCLVVDDTDIAKSGMRDCARHHVPHMVLDTGAGQEVGII